MDAPVARRIASGLVGAPLTLEPGSCWARIGSRCFYRENEPIREGPLLHEALGHDDSAFLEIDYVRALRDACPTRASNAVLEVTLRGLEDVQANRRVAACLPPAFESVRRDLLPKASPDSWQTRPALLAYLGASVAEGLLPDGLVAEQTYDIEGGVAAALRATRRARIAIERLSPPLELAASGLRVIDDVVARARPYLRRPAKSRSRDRVRIAYAFRFLEIVAGILHPIERLAASDCSRVRQFLGSSEQATREARSALSEGDDVVVAALIEAAFARRSPWVLEPDDGIDRGTLARELYDRYLRLLCAGPQPRSPPVVPVLDWSAAPRPDAVLEIADRVMGRDGAALQRSFDRGLRLVEPATVAAVAGSRLSVQRLCAFLAAGRETKVFLRRGVCLEACDALVVFLADISGSMGNAAHASLGLALAGCQAVETLGARSAIVTFNAVARTAKGLSEAASAPDVRRRAAGAVVGVSGIDACCTDDLKGLRRAEQVLQKASHSADVKLVVVIGDGCHSSNSEAVARQLQAMEASGTQIAAAWFGAGPGTGGSAYDMAVTGVTEETFAGALDELLELALQRRSR